MAIGAADYVTKPFDITLLVDKVRQVVREVPSHALANDTAEVSATKGQGAGKHKSWETYARRY